MNLSRDDILLVKALRYCLGTLELDEIKELNESEWQGLYTNAVQHGVSSFLWYHLSPVASALEIPLHVGSDFARSHLRSAGRGVIVRNQLASLLKNFEKIKNPVIVLKGSYLADKVYKDFSIRPMTDIDILVKQSDLHNIESALLSSGYKALHSTSEPIWYNHYVYKPGSTGVNVEVHLEPRIKNNDRKFDSSELWERSEATTIVGCNARILGLEDMITYHCFHQSCHLLKHFGLRSLCDLALLMKTHSNNINWNLLFARANQWHALKDVHLCMNLVAFYYHISIPQSFLSSDAIAEPRLPALESFNFEIFNSKKGSDPSRHTREAPSAARLIDSLKHGTILALFSRAVFPTKRQIVKRYSSEIPSRPIIFLYAVNLKRLIVRYTILLWKMACGNPELKSEIGSLVHKNEWFNSR